MARRKNQGCGEHVVYHVSTANGNTITFKGKALVFASERSALDYCRVAFPGVRVGPSGSRAVLSVRCVSMTPGEFESFRAVHTDGIDSVVDATYAARARTVADRFYEAVFG